MLMLGNVESSIRLGLSISAWNFEQSHCEVALLPLAAQITKTHDFRSSELGSCRRIGSMRTA